jgi:hypothetical protein
MAADLAANDQASLRNGTLATVTCSVTDALSFAATAHFETARR